MRKARRWKEWRITFPDGSMNRWTAWNSSDASDSVRRNGGEVIRVLVIEILKKRRKK